MHFFIYLWQLFLSISGLTLCCNHFQVTTLPLLEYGFSSSIVPSVLISLITRKFDPFVFNLLGWNFSLTLLSIIGCQDLSSSFTIIASCWTFTSSFVPDVNDSLILSCFSLISSTSYFFFFLSFWSTMMYNFFEYILKV